MNEVPLIIRPGAEIDIISAFDWYSSQLSGLGEDLINSIDDTFENISQNPELYPKVYKEVRRALVKKFPFCVFYLFESNSIDVLAVFHAKRNPKSWKIRK